MSEEVSLKEYLEKQIELRDRAVILALETVREAMKKDDNRMSTLLAVVSLVVAVAVAVFEVAKHT